MSQVSLTQSADFARFGDRWLLRESDRSLCEPLSSWALLRRGRFVSRLSMVMARILAAGTPYNL